jgi:non-ribosomal peptide synthetase component F
MAQLCQCVQELWAVEQDEETALVQSWVNTGGSACEGEEASVEVSLKEVKEWQQELRKTLKLEGELVVGVHVAPFSIEETALMVLAAGYESWTYVPIDVQLPVARQLELLQTAGVQRLVTTVGSLLAKLFASDARTHARVESRVVDLKTSPFQPVQVVAISDESVQQGSGLRRVKAETGGVVAPLYVLFTSGTTEKPRGLLGTRAGAWARLEWMWTTYPFAESEERVLRATKLSFVDSAWEVLGAVLKRVPLVHLQAPRDQREGVCSQRSLTRSVVLDDSARFLKVMKGERVTRFTAVPSVLEVLLLQLGTGGGMASLRYVLSSGETLSLHVLQQLMTQLPGVAILNLYGEERRVPDVHLSTV